MKQTSKHNGIEELKKLALENGDGVYLIYADHLSCDAVIAFTVRDNTITDEQEFDPYGGSIKWHLENEYLNVRISLQVYGFTAAWFTFPSKWHNDQEWLKKYAYAGITYIPVTILDVE